MINTNIYSLSARGYGASGEVYVISTEFGGETELRACDRCGSDVYFKIGPRRCLMSSGPRWYDVLSASSNGSLFSERAIEAFDSVNARGYRVVPVTIELSPSRKGPKAPPPKYFTLELTSCIRLDVAASGYDLKTYCSLCARKTALTHERGYIRRSLVLDMSTYDGSDMFAVGHLESRLEYCNLKILEAARKYELTNAAFQPWAWKQDPARFMNIIDHIGGPWPPVA
jgi:hypothetical protein